MVIESDYAPESVWDLPQLQLLQQLASLLGLDPGIWGLDSFVSRWDYEKVGRNRGVITFEFSHSASEEWDLDDYQGVLLGSTWTYLLTFTSDGAAQYTRIITREGQLPIVEEGFVDFGSDASNLDEFPEELLLPDDPPQASGEDISGVEVAPAFTNRRIGPDEVQTFLVSSAGAGYQPGDWLEPKDGSNQRMMVVGTGPPAAGKPVASSDADSPRPYQGILKTRSTIFPHASRVFTATMTPRAKRASQRAYSDLELHSHPTVRRLHAAWSRHTDARCEVLFTAEERSRSGSIVSGRLCVG